MKILLTWILFETIVGQIFLVWLEHHADLAIVSASNLATEPIYWRETHDR